MATTLPARIEEYTPLQSQSTFTKAEMAAFKDLHSYISTHTKDTILWYWELGKKVGKIYAAATADDKSLYGKKVLLRQAIALGYKTDRQLRNAMDVVKVFKTKEAFNVYLKMRGEAGNRLQWSHMVYLAAVGDEKVRGQLAATALAQSWSAEELWARVRDVCERKSRGVRSPKTKVPTSARGCLTHVQAQASKFNDNFDKAWTGDAFDLRKTVAEIPGDKLSEQFLESVQSVRGEVAKMKEKANELSNLLTMTEKDIEERLLAQAAADAAAADMEDEDEEVVDDIDFVYEEPDAEEAEEEDPEEAEEDEVVNMAEHAAEQRRKARASAKPPKGKKRPGRVGTSR